MKVVHVVAEMGSGGAEWIVETLAMDQLARRWPVVVITEGGRRADAVADAGAEVLHAPLARTSLMNSIEALWTLRACRAADVVHAHNLRMTALARIALIGSRARLVATHHGVTPERRRFVNALLPRLADEVVTVEARAAREFGARNVHIIVNGVTEGRQLDKTAARRRLGIDAKEFVFICVARLAPQKRHSVLLRAFSLANQAAQLLVVGDGSEAERLRQLAAELSIVDRVRFLGERSDVPELLAAADCFVLTSRWEGLPIALLEAMGHALPVIASDVDGTRILLGDSGSELVDPDDVYGFARAMRHAVGDASWRTASGERGRQLVMEKYTSSAMANAYARIYAGDPAPGPDDERER